MRLSKIVLFNGADITVKELTVKELDELQCTEKESSMIDRLLYQQRIESSYLSRSTGIDIDMLVGYTPSAMQPLIDAFKEVNPVFFSMMVAEEEWLKEHLKNQPLPLLQT